MQDAENKYQLEIPRERDENHLHNIEELINLKFAVERQINSLHESFEKYKRPYLLNSVSDLEIYKIFATHSINIELFGSSFLEKQTELLGNIEKILLNECDHNWIHDVIDEPLERSKNICYCSKCYCRKN
jgi:hypothetical protein